MDGNDTGEGISLFNKQDGLLTELGFSESTNGSKSMKDVFFITAALTPATVGLKIDVSKLLISDKS